MPCAAACARSERGPFTCESVGAVARLLGFAFGPPHPSGRAADRPVAATAAALFRNSRRVFRPLLRLDVPSCILLPQFPADSSLLPILCCRLPVFSTPPCDPS